MISASVGGHENKDPLIIERISMTMPFTWEAVGTSTAPSMAALAPADGCAVVVVIVIVVVAAAVVIVGC